MHVAKESQDARGLQDLAERAAAVARPKALYKICYVEKRGYDSVAIDGVTFASRVLRVNLDKVERAFPYVATCDTEVDEVVAGVDDFMVRFWLDTVKEMALTASRTYLTSHLKRRYALRQTSMMNPGWGARDLWPIEQQRALFLILDPVEDLVGVRLTDSFLMIPNKSVSGILFPTEFGFEACPLCPRDVCPSRRAPYDESLARSYEYAET